MRAGRKDGRILIYSHDKFGLGRVVLVENECVTVRFGSQQLRIDSPYRKLTKL